MFYCPDCPARVFEDYLDFVNHLLITHPERIYCDTCLAGFTSKKYLSRHIREKHLKSTFECVECKTKFTTNRSLQRHTTEKHTVTTFDCKKCNTSFTSNRSLQQHNKEKHTKVTTFDCKKCNMMFISNRSLQQHIKEKHTVTTFDCKKCNMMFISNRSLQQHIKEKHLSKMKYPCPQCTKEFVSERTLNQHITDLHCGSSSFSHKPHTSTSGNQSKTTKHRCNHCSEIFTVKRSLLRHVKEKHSGRKHFPCTDCDEKFTTGRVLIQHLREVHRKKGATYICPNCEKAFVKSTNLEKHLSTGCLSSNILKNKHILVSPTENTLKSVLSGRNPEVECDWKSMEDLDIKALTHFENETHTSLNMYKIFRGQLLVHHVSNNIHTHNHVDVLYYNGGFFYISDFDELLRSLRLKHHSKVKFCRRCFAGFYENSVAGTADEQLITHREYCLNDGVQPQAPKNPRLRFKNYGRTKRMRFTIYCDFEALTQPSDIKFGHSSEVTQKHVPFAFGYLVKDAENDEITEYQSYCGLDAPQKLMEMLEDEVKLIEAKLYAKRIKKVPKLTRRQQFHFKYASICHQCRLGDFDRIKNPKVISHCHISGQFLGAAHRLCNLFYRDQTHVNVIVHNLSKYDQNFIFPILGRDSRAIKVIPHTVDRYVSFSKRIGKMELRFVDSLKFLGKSLDKLAIELPRENFHMCRKFTNDNEFELIIRKNVFPYDWLTDMEKLNSTSLPPREAFTSLLTGEELKDEDYKFAQRAWETFNHKTMKDYTMTYLKSDVLILSDVFEDFRNMCLEYYNLDACYYLTAPSLSFDAMLRKTGQTIELMTDLNMIGFVSKALRGGLASVTHRHSRANNKYMGSLYDPSKPSLYHWDIDVNSMYPWAMSQAMPCGGFKWINPDELGDVMKIPDDGATGYFMEVTLIYDEALHDLHNDMPLCPVVGVPPNAETDHVYLLESLEDRHNYVLHYRTLKLALKNGLKLKEITKVLQFDQSNWLKPYIDFNSTKRQEAGSNAFKYEFFKLMSNSVYGKFCERVDRRLDIRVATNERQFLKYVRSPLCIEERMCSENMMLIHMRKKNIVYDKPLYVGVAILEISKIRLYDFHYDFIIKKYGTKAQLHYKDTDSLYYSIITNDLYEDIKNDPELFEELDTSSYPVDHPLYSVKNHVVMGKFKDEAKGDIATEFVGLRTKEYAKRKYIVKEKREVDHAMKSKGIQKAAVKRYFTFQMYFERLHATVDYHVENVLIRARGHELETVKIQKKALNPKDRKRFIRKDGIRTLAWGHYRIKELD